MIIWLLLGTAVYLLGAYVPSLLLIGQIGMGAYLGSRDDEGQPSQLRQRALRVHRNAAENFPVFALLGALALAVPEADLAQAKLGAQIYVLARIAYIPLYLAAVPVARSVVFVIGFAGLVMMALALV